MVAPASRTAAEARHFDVAVVVKDCEVLNTHELGQPIGVYRLTSQVTLVPGLEAGLRQVVDDIPRQRLRERSSPF